MSEKDIGALWVREGKNGTFLTGKIKVKGEEVSIVVFQNHYKKKDTHPDYRIYEGRDKQRTAQAQPANKDDAPF